MDRQWHRLGRSDSAPSSPAPTATFSVDMCATGPPSEWQLRPNAELSKEFYSDVEVRGDLGEHDTLLSIEKA